MTDRCLFAGTTSPRVLPDRHEPDCDECDCPGCVKCLEAHCGMDGKTHLDFSHPLHCPECVGSVRDDLTEIRDLCTHLRERALTGSDAQGRRFASMRLPGGDPLVIHGPVGDGSADQRLRWAPVYDPEHPDADEDGYRPASDDDNGHSGSLELPGDPEPPALTLGMWEDAWRKWLGHDSGSRFNYARSIGYLLRHLTMMAQALDRTTAVGLEFAPDFGEFARDIRRLRRHLEDRLADGERDDTSRVKCLTCGVSLARAYAEPDPCNHRDAIAARVGREVRDRIAGPLGRVAYLGIKAQVDAALAMHACDQGGRRDDWRCPRCRRVHDPGEFARAERQAMTSDDADAWLLLTDAAKSIGRSVHTLRTWVAAGKVRTDRELIEGEGGTMMRVWCWWPDVRHADIESGRRNRSA